MRGPTQRTCWRGSSEATRSMTDTGRTLVVHYAPETEIKAGRTFEATLATRESGPVPEVTVLAVTYQEHPWITEAVFTSVFRELASLEGLSRSPRVVVATGSRRDERERSPGARPPGHR